MPPSPGRLPVTRSLPLLLLLTACPGGDDPETWTAIAEADTRGAFLMVWSSAPDDVWVVGGQPDVGIVLRGDTTGLTEVPLPEGTPLVNWVNGTGPDDVWVAGLSGTLLHWDGSGWTDHSVDTEAAFWGLYAKGPDEAWAVGGESAWGGEEAMIHRWDGTSWTPLDVPDVLEPLGNLFKVHHDGSTLWSCGFKGAVVRSSDGTTLEAVSTGYPGDIVTVHGQPGADPIFVGGRGTGAVLEVSGDAVAVTTQAPAGLSGVHVVDANTAVVVGERGYAATYDIATDTLTEVTVPSDDVLHGVHVTADGTIWTTGGNLYTSGDTFEGSIWTLPLPEASE